MDNSPWAMCMTMENLFLSCFSYLYNYYIKRQGFTSKGMIEINGSDIPALAAGVLDYLNSVNASISWAATGGDNLVAALPPPSAGLPPPPGGKPRKRNTPFGRRYMYNTCTYGYSMVWWDWPRWSWGPWVSRFMTSPRPTAPP